MSPDDEKNENEAENKDDDKPAEKPKTTRKPRARKPAARTAAEAKKAAAASDGKSAPDKAADDSGSSGTSSAKSSSGKSSSAGAKSKTSEESASSSSTKADDEEALDGEVVSNFDWELRARYGLRFLLAILAGFGVSVSTFLIYVITIINFVFIMVSGEKLDAATSACSRLSVYVKQLLDFICYKSDKLIFPFAPFPEAEEDDDDEGVTIDGKAERL